jgi:branched-chain amino acid transport system ATP-binding protein
VAITDDVRPVGQGAADVVLRRELLPTAREVEQGATAADAHFEQRPTSTKRSAKTLLSSYLQTFDPRTVRGSKFPLFVLAGMAMFQAWDDIVIGVAYPYLRADFAFNLAFIIVFTNLIGIVTDLFAPLIGWVADRFPRVWLVRAGAVILHGSSLIFALAGSFGGFLTSRGLALVGVGLIDPSKPPLTSDYYPPASRVRVFGFVGSATLVGVAIAPLLAGILIESISWRACVALFGGLGLLVSLGSFFLREPKRGYFDLIEAGLTPEEAEAAPRPKPLPFLEAFRVGYGIKTLRRVWWATVFMPATLFGQIYIFIHLAEQGYDARQSGVVLAAAGVAALLFVPFTGSVASRLVHTNPGRIMTLLGGVYVVQAVTLFGIAMFPSPVVAVVLVVPFMATTGFVVPGSQAVMSLIIPPSMLGQGLAIMLPFRLIARVAMLLVIVISPYLSRFVTGQSQSILLALVIPSVLAAIIISGGARTMAGDIRTARAMALASAESKESRLRGRNKMLICRDVEVTYDGTQVLFGVDFDVEEGELVALLGTNGAGKSTLMRAICGLQRASNGAIFLDGADITQQPAHLNARRGIVMVPGGHAIFPGLTVEENLRTAAWMYSANETYVAERTDEVLQLFPVLRDRLQTSAGNMSGGEQQMLAIGQALIMKPRLLMIDELSLGLAPAVIDTMLDTLRRLNAEGTTIVLIEQSLNVAMTIARRAVFMEKGEVRFDGPTEELMRRPELIRAVFMAGAVTGGSTARSRARQGESRERLLQVQDVAVSFGGVSALAGATLEVGPDEIVGIIGPNGAGKTSLFDVISGFVRPDSGAVLMNGTDVTASSPEVRAHLGLGRSFQNAQLFPSLTVRENIAVAMERAIKVKHPLLNALWLPKARQSERLVGRRVDGLIDLLRLGAYADKFVNELSTGTRRSVDIACIMASAPKMLLLDEPSSGLAQAESEALGPVIERLARDAGCSVLVIEHDVGLVSSISHRLYAMELGAVIASGSPSQVVSDPRVLSSYLAATEEVVARSDLNRILVPTYSATAEENGIVHDNGQDAPGD